MAYAFKDGHSIEREVRRIADRQLRLAIARMQTLGDRQSDEAIHEARRHLKKLCALRRLVAPVLDGDTQATKQQIRTVSRALGPIADSEAAVATFDRIAELYRRDLPPRSVALLRQRLVHRWMRIDRRATEEQVLERAATALEQERTRVAEWRLHEHGFAAIAPGLERSLRRVRRAMSAAAEAPTDRHFGKWRRRVKDHWFHVRLIDARCGGHLIDYERTLEQLDDALGEYRNCVLLQDVITGARRLPRLDAARLLRVVRCYKSELRRDAWRLAERLPTEPAEFVQNLRPFWRATTAGAVPVTHAVQPRVPCAPTA